MASERQILIVLEDGIFNTDTFLYSVRLAKRMGCCLSVLMLIPYDNGLIDNMAIIKRMNSVICEFIQEKGINVVSVIQQGDKASQFFKHLAVQSSLATIVWGSDSDIVSGKRRKHSEHWFAKVRAQIKCPVVTPKTRKKHNRKKINN